MNDQPIVLDDKAQYTFTVTGAEAKLIADLIASQPLANVLNLYMSFVAQIREQATPKPEAVNGTAKQSADV